MFPTFTEIQFTSENWKSFEEQNAPEGSAPVLSRPPEVLGASGLSFGALLRWLDGQAWTGLLEYESHLGQASAKSASPDEAIRN